MKKKIKVQYTSRATESSFYGGSRYTNYPRIQMEGKWLEALGFHIGDTLDVEYEEGNIHISLARQPDAMVAAEAAGEYSGKKSRKAPH